MPEITQVVDQCEKQDLRRFTERNIAAEDIRDILPRCPALQWRGRREQAGGLADVGGIQRIVAGVRPKVSAIRLDRSVATRPSRSYRVARVNAASQRRAVSEQQAELSTA